MEYKRKAERNPDKYVTMMTVMMIFVFLERAKYHPRVIHGIVPKVTMMPTFM